MAYYNIYQILLSEHYWTPARHSIDYIIVSCSKLFIKRNFPAHVARLLINLYANDFVRVSQCGVTSDHFF
jgi:hypothetical protein